ncbi:MAG TPA: hypothetical protein VMF69_17390 [Gemmataceae bacterium]|nr:hypothetical protein [Gemmataceae bacterium]
MNCRLTDEFLQQSLDGTPIESPEWLAHLHHCADCRALASTARRLQDGLRLLPSPLPPPDLSQRIVQRVLLDRHRALRRTRRRWAVSLTLAAGLLVALSLRLDWRGSPTGTNQRLTQHLLTDSSPMQKEKSAPTLRESAAQLGEVFTELSNETAQETVGQTRRWVSNVPSPDMPKIDLTAMQPPTRPLREAGEGVSEGLEVVTTSARRAVDLFLRELPMETNTD